MEERGEKTHTTSVSTDTVAEIATAPVDVDALTSDISVDLATPETLTSTQRVKTRKTNAQAFASSVAETRDAPAEEESSASSRRQHAPLLPIEHGELLMDPALDISEELGYFPCGDAHEDHAGAALLNAGNTCYLNALLHAMARVSRLRGWFQQHLELANKAHERLGCTLCSLAQDVWRLCLDADGAAFVPETVRTRALWSDDAFANNVQQDAAEAFVLLMDKLDGVDEGAMNASCKAAADLNNGRNSTRLTTPMWKCLGGTHTSTLFCTGCRLRSCTAECWSTLELHLPDEPCELQELLLAYWGEEPVDDEMAEGCTRCANTPQRTRILEPKRWPPVLVVTLKRWVKEIHDGLCRQEKQHKREVRREFASVS